MNQLRLGNGAATARDEMLPYKVLRTCVTNNFYTIHMYSYIEYGYIGMYCTEYVLGCYGGLNYSLLCTLDGKDVSCRRYSVQYSVTRLCSVLYSTL